MLLKKTLLLKNKFENKVNISIEKFKKEIIENIKLELSDEIKEVKKENESLKKQIDKLQKMQQVCSQDISTLASAINELYKVYELLLFKHFENLKDDKDDIYH